MPSQNSGRMYAGHEAGEGERPLVPAELRLAADRVAVVEHLGAGVHEADHRLDVLGHRGAGPIGELLRLLGRVVRRVAGSMPSGTYDSGSCAEVWSVTMSTGTPRWQHLRDQGGRVADDADGQRLAVALGGQRQLDAVVQRVGDHVQVARLDPAAQPVRVDVDDQADAVVHGDRERLRAAHAAAAGGQRQRAGQRAVEPLGGHRGERLVRALQDALGADVDPGAGGHLAVHGQAQSFSSRRNSGQVAQSPTRLELAISTRGRPLVRTEHADRPPGLHQHRLVVLERGQRADQRVVARPVPGGLAGAAVDDQVLRALGDVRVEVVLQHPHGGLLRPALRGEGRAARGADRRPLSLAP